MIPFFDGELNTVYVRKFYIVLKSYNFELLVNRT